MLYRTNSEWRTIGLPVALTLGAILAWLALVLAVDAIRFVVFNPRAKTGFEVFLAVGFLFGAFVLALVPVGAAAHRLRWVASGFLVLGIGGLGVGYLYPLIAEAPQLNAMLYGSLYVQTVGLILIAVGLVPTVTPEVRCDRMAALAALLLLIGIGLMAAANDLALPALVRIDGMTSIIDHNPGIHGGVPVTHAHVTDVQHLVAEAHAAFPGLTPWYRGLALVPLAAGVVAAWGAFRQLSQAALGAWLLIAVLLLAGSQLHFLFWPSMYSSILTTTSLLRLAVAIVVIAGGVIELRRIVDERAALLTDEQERVRRLEELTTLKADFTAIVAHELATPLGAIRSWSELLAAEEVPPALRRQVSHAIGTEVLLLQRLVGDVQASAEVERDDFHVQLRRTPLASLLADAAAYARTLPATHPVTIDQQFIGNVLADPDRMGQVLRNLLTNAIRHTPAGTPISLSATRSDGEVTIAVTDHGPGISLQDRSRIFEKFGRGTSADLSERPGYGLGLYVCRRILQAHGSDLHVDSSPEEGTTFWFALKEAP